MNLHLRLRRLERVIVDRTGSSVCSACGSGGPRSGPGFLVIEQAVTAEEAEADGATFCALCGIYSRRIGFETAGACLE